MTIENKLKIHKAFLAILSGFLFAMVFFIIFDNKTSQNASKGANIKSIDTVVVRDTLRIEVPVEKVKYNFIFYTYRYSLPLYTLQVISPYH